jgi:hypothetical protein
VTGLKFQFEVPVQGYDPAPWNGFTDCSLGHSPKLGAGPKQGLPLRPSAWSKCLVPNLGATETAS